MAYNFKNLADVELLDTMPENAKVIVEVDGATKRAPQQSFVNAEALEEVPEGATVLVEVNGEIKRVPGSGLGGIKTAIIKSNMYDEAMTSVKQGKKAPAQTYTCLNMTFEKAYESMENGEQLGVFGMLNIDGLPATLYGISAFLGTAAFGVPCLTIIFMTPMQVEGFPLYWTAEGISETAPGSGDK